MENKKSEVKEMSILDEVKTRMKEMQEKKASELARLADLTDQAWRKSAIAEGLMREAAEAMNVENYERAKRQKESAQVALEMYKAKYDQIAAQEYITEVESNKVIRSLLDYEKQLEEDFQQKLGEQKEALEQLLTGYRDEVAEVEKILTIWPNEIRKNYIDWEGVTTYYDPVTKKSSNRSPNPIPIRKIAYTGGSAADKLQEYLLKAR